MKFFILALIISVALAVPTDKDEEDWQSFKKQFKKSYSSKNTESKRKNAFLKNKAKVDEINRGQGAYKAKVYPFHDLEDEEFFEQFANLKEPENEEIPPQQDSQLVELPQSRQTLPSSYDSRVSWKLAPIRDQKSCGSCWAFAAINTLETAVWKKYYSTYGDWIWDLSEQELVDCGKRDPTYGSNGCQGFWFTGAIDYLNKVWGLTLEQDYAYTATFGTCRTDKPKYFGGPTWVKIANDVTSIKNAIMQYGSLGVSVYVDNGWASYSGGVYTNASITTFTLSSNHAVNLVGWGYDSTYGMDYWLIRNSWNTWWGEQGYIRVAQTPAGQMKPDKVYATKLP